jgi:hypothetical protein
MKNEKLSMSDIGLSSGVISKYWIDLRYLPVGRV